MVAELWLSGPANAAESYGLQPFLLRANLSARQGSGSLPSCGQGGLVLQEDFNSAEAKGVICEREGRSEVV